MISLEELRSEVESGAIDTVVVAFTDMQGRLMGKRLHGEFFVEQAAEHGIEGCDYLLALEMEMDPVPGYALASWDQGYGDFRLAPDFATLRRIPWLEGTALVLADVLDHDGSDVKPSPRQVLKAQVERAEALGYTPMFGSELEFFLLKESYEEAHAKHYRDLTPSVPYILDYHILAATYDEPLIRQIRNGMHGAGIRVETSKGEAWPGQHEINFRYCRRGRDGGQPRDLQERRQGDRTPERLLGHLHGEAGSHVDRQLVPHPLEPLAGREENAFEGESDVFKQYLAGQIAALKELAIFVAPTINSYKRFAAGSWAPTTLAWGHDNRTCGFRIVGHGQALRTETRIPGGDANPYLAFAALLAAGLHGIENELELPPALEGNAYESDAERFPHSLREAIAALEEGSVARKALGDEVVDHYLNYARTEQRLFDEVVTCYERERMFERG